MVPFGYLLGACWGYFLLCFSIGFLVSSFFGFGRLLGAIWEALGGSLGDQSGGKSGKNSGFVEDPAWGSHLGRFLEHFGRMLGRFWEHLERIWGGCWEDLESQNLSKRHQKTYQKKKRKRAKHKPVLARNGKRAEMGEL